MTYATLKVRLQVGQPNGPVLLAAVRLAKQFSAGMIGGVACEPMQLVYSDSYTAGDAYEQDRKERLPRRRLGCRRCTRAQLKLPRSGYCWRSRQAVAGVAMRRTKADWRVRSRGVPAS